MKKQVSSSKWGGSIISRLSFSPEALLRTIWRGAVAVTLWSAPLVRRSVIGRSSIVIFSVTAATSVLFSQVPLPLPVSWPCVGWQWDSARRRGENDQVLSTRTDIIIHITTQGPITMQHCTCRQPRIVCLN